MQPIIPVSNADYSALELVFRLSIQTVESSHQPLTTLAPNPFAQTIGEGSLSPLTTFSPVNSAVIGQGQKFDQDFLGDAGKILNNFVESGQVWALLIGIVLGYVIRGITTYS